MRIPWLGHHWENEAFTVLPEQEAGAGRVGELAQWMSLVCSRGL